MAEQLRDIAAADTQPLGEPLDEMAVEAPVEEVNDPTIFEPGYWEADDAAVGEAFDALRDPKTGMIPMEKLPQFAEFTYHLAVQNRLRQKEIALQIGTLMEAVSLLIQTQQAHEAKPARKRTAKVPKAALPDAPDAA